VSAESLAPRLDAWSCMRGMIALAALALLASGCATYAWSRPDTPPDLAAQDEAECAQLARDAARDIAFSAFPRLYAGPMRSWPHAGWGAWGDPYWWGPASDPLWQMDVEQRIHDRCMRNRGYDLYRVPKD
jgi:hypothetical protein